MSNLLECKQMTAVVLNLEPLVKHLSNEQFYQLCMANRDIPLELSAKGELIIVMPIGGEGGIQEADLITDLTIWNRQTGLGKIFSSSTIFRLPNGANRSPDAAWVVLDRWEALNQDDRIKFPPICPDFAIELRSPTDRIKDLQDKMQEYLDNGLRLGWLINPQQRQVEIYRPAQPVDIINQPTLLSGENVLPGFELSLP
jgi:Uma2 family endonuclease